MRDRVEGSFIRFSDIKQRVPGVVKATGRWILETFDM